MTLPVGQISLSEVNTELSISPASTLITMNDAAVRTLAGVGGSGTTISMQNLQGKASLIALTIAGDTNNFNLHTTAVAAGWSGQQLQLTINPGIVVGSTSTGAFALLVPSSLNPAPSVTIINNGRVAGRGGNGGLGGRGGPPGSPLPGTAGALGGNAVFLGRPAIITNNGTLAGGGGGGGGGGKTDNPFGFSRQNGGGGGGGAGRQVGTGGTSQGPAPAGSPGALTTGGAGGDGRTSPTNNQPLPALRGGAGGAAGAVGIAGSGPGAGGAGAGGNYIVGLPLATFPVTGTRQGGSS